METLDFAIFLALNYFWNVVKSHRDAFLFEVFVAFLEAFFSVFVAWMESIWF